jgi:hypothetical protein
VQLQCAQHWNGVTQLHMSFIQCSATQTDQEPNLVTYSTQRNSDDTFNLVKLLRIYTVQLQYAQDWQSYAATYIAYTVQCYTNRSRTLLPIVRNWTSPSIPCTPWDTEHRQPHQRKVTPTTRKYMATIQPAYTPYHHTQASYPTPYIFSYPTE